LWLDSGNASKSDCASLGDRAIAFVTASTRPGRAGSAKARLCMIWKKPTSRPALSPLPTDSESSEAKVDSGLLQNRVRGVPRLDLPVDHEAALRH